MKLTTQIAGLEQASVLPPKPLHLAIGMFDGVHLGHRAVIDAAVLSARLSGGIAAALTFNPHPSRIFRPDDPVELLLPHALNASRLRDAGLDTVITQTFSREFAAIEASALVPMLCEALPGLAGIYVGENWRFGRRRSGDVHLLVREGRKAGLKVFSAPRVNLDGDPISSTRIRAALREGRIEEVNTLLGYVYHVEGVVVPGRKIGRTIGFPTLNVSWHPECAPRYGVYAVRVFAPGETRARAGVANFGLRPTVDDTREPLLEVHLLSAPDFGEGAAVRVEWCRFIRAEQRFAGVDALREQIARDVTTATAYFDSQISGRE